jgi:hypothetical protein
MMTCEWPQIRLEDVDLHIQETFSLKHNWVMFIDNEFCLQAVNDLLKHDALDGQVRRGNSFINFVALESAAIIKAWFNGINELETKQRPLFFTWKKEMFKTLMSAIRLKHPVFGEGFLVLINRPVEFYFVSKKVEFFKNASELTRNVIRKKDCDLTDLLADSKENFSRLITSKSWLPGTSVQIGIAYHPEISIEPFVRQSFPFLSELLEISAACTSHGLVQVHFQMEKERGMEIVLDDTGDNILEMEERLRPDETEMQQKLLIKLMDVKKKLKEAGFSPVFTHSVSGNTYRFLVPENLTEHYAQSTSALHYCALSVLNPEPEKLKENLGRESVLRFIDEQIQRVCALPNQDASVWAFLLHKIRPGLKMLAFDRAADLALQLERQLEQVDPNFDFTEQLQSFLETYEYSKKG